jgi:hypothetical protein
MVGSAMLAAAVLMPVLFSVASDHPCPPEKVQPLLVSASARAMRWRKM